MINKLLQTLNNDGIARRHTGKPMALSHKVSKNINVSMKEYNCTIYSGSLLLSYWACNFNYCKRLAVSPLLVKTEKRLVWGGSFQFMNDKSIEGTLNLAF